MSNPGKETTDNQAIRELRDSVNKLNKSTKFSSGVMILLTVVLVIFTAVLIYQGVK
jgi:hypothetical protein